MKEGKIHMKNFLFFMTQSDSKSSVRKQQYKNCTIDNTGAVPVEYSVSAYEKKLNKKITILTSLLVVSSLLNIVLLCILFQPNSNSIIGTYCTGTGRNEHDNYIVFQSDGLYTIYTQFNIIEKGTYTIEDTNIYLLQSKDNGEKKYVIWNGANLIYCFGIEGTIITYDKVDSTPMYINLPQNETLS